MFLNVFVLVHLLGKRIIDWKKIGSDPLSNGEKMARVNGGMEAIESSSGACQYYYAAYSHGKETIDFCTPCDS